MRFFSFSKAAPINIEFTINIALSIALILTVISVFVPFSPLMPRAHLDGGWELGMNEFVAQGLSFGRDIFFTFGPYASIFTEMYHPSTDFLFLQRKDTIEPEKKPVKFTTETHKFGEIITLPSSGQALFAKINIRPIRLGRG